MQLNEKGLKDRKIWEAAGYRLPGYDRSRIIEATKEAPFWIHFGAGNIDDFKRRYAEKRTDRGRRLRL